MKATYSMKIFKQSIKVLVLGFVLLSGCREEKIFIDKLQQPIVNAYLFDDRPLDFVRVQESSTFDSDKGNEPISDLVITVEGNNKKITLTPDKDKPGYYKYNGTASDFPIVSGSTYNLSFQYNGKDVYSNTIVPFPPVELEADNNLLSYYSFSGANTNAALQKIMVENEKQKIVLKWKNPDKKYFFTVIECLESKKTPIFSNGSGTSVGVMVISGGGMGIIDGPTNADSIVINSMMVNYLGKHKATLYAINNEYARLYDNMMFDSRDMKEPPSNIFNGKGIFAGFTSKSIEFTVAMRK